jgi:hypothetical protein
MVNRREFLLSGAATVASPFVCKAYGENLSELELILALDTSGSVFDNDKRHWIVQLQGHIFALSQHKLRQKFVEDRVYLRIVTWSDYRNPVQQVFAGLVNSFTVCDQAIEVLHAQRNRTCGRRHCSPTHHFWLVKGVNEIAPQSKHRVLDVSTDQAPEKLWQADLNVSREIFYLQGGTINALAVKMSKEGQLALRSQLCSPDGFCIGVDTDAHYAEALTSKIWSEIVS